MECHVQQVDTPPRRLEVPVPLHLGASASLSLCVRSSLLRATNTETRRHGDTETGRHRGLDAGWRRLGTAAGRRPVRVDRSRSVKRGRRACPIGRPPNIHLDGRRTDRRGRCSPSSPSLRIESHRTLTDVPLLRTIRRIAGLVDRLSDVQTSASRHGTSNRVGPDGGLAGRDVGVHSRLYLWIRRRADPRAYLESRT